ncbi:MAG: bifunctional folylpolyglutamate synthase/dihydrofolate synthase [Candidatus Omnitrophota bacterium]
MSMNYREILDYLNGANEFKAMRLGLENTRIILNHMGTDITRVPCIQVAGSNGKGSTSHFAASILQASGKKVGLFTSPHLEDIRERIRIDNRLISEQDFVRSFTAIHDLSETLLKQELLYSMPTFFEYTFLMAVHYFCLENVDAAVFEVGLGGRLDATSALTPAVSVITGISKEHTHILGKRVSEIAAEKAGIIKKGVPIVCGCKTGTAAHRVIQKMASENGAPFFRVVDSRNRLEIENKGDYYRCVYRTEADTYSFEVHLRGTHQAFNAAAAIRAIQCLSHMWRIRPMAKESIAEGIQHTFIPARIEVMNTNPNVILDGGHNMESIAALAHFLKEKNLMDLTLIFGVLADKNYRKMVDLLLPYTGRVILTQPLSGRALPSSGLRSLFERNSKPVIIKDNIDDACEQARLLNADILITGSFYLVGAARKVIMHIMQTGGRVSPLT